MALWAYIPGKVLEDLGTLPDSWPVVKTGRLITDLNGSSNYWANACGWWNLDNLDVDLLIQTNELSPAEVSALTSAVIAGIARRDSRRDWVGDVETAWGFAKDVGIDHLDNPWSDPTTGPPPSGAASLALHGQQITYLYSRVQQITRWIVGGGTVDTPGIGDALVTIMNALLDVIEQSDGIELPD
jgi:hypothetical protein